MKIIKLNLFMGAASLAVVFSTSFSCPAIAMRCYGERMWEWSDQRYVSPSYSKRTADQDANQPSTTRAKSSTADQSAEEQPGFFMSFWRWLWGSSEVAPAPAPAPTPVVVRQKWIPIFPRW